MGDPSFRLISLRPVGGHGGLRRAAARADGEVVAVSPWRTDARDDADARAALREAIACPLVVFTSPAAVQAAARLQSLPRVRGNQVFGVGERTRRALQAAGIDHAQAPTRMDSEGLLALPAFASLKRGDALGLVTAPGGRGEIARVLGARGVDIVRADVYARVPVTLSAATRQRLQRVLDDAAAPVFLALSSGGAFEAVLTQLPHAMLPALRRVRVIAASDRLAGIARERGFNDIVIAASARPGDMVAAIG